MLRVRQAIIVEGRYDKAKLHSLVDATIVTTDGFGVFRNREKLAYIRRLAAQTGIIILTDSDAAGFRIRGFLAGRAAARGRRCGGNVRAGRRGEGVLCGRQRAPADQGRFCGLGAVRRGGQRRPAPRAAFAARPAGAYERKRDACRRQCAVYA